MCVLTHVHRAMKSETYSGKEGFLRECRHIIPPADWLLKSSVTKHMMYTYKYVSCSHCRPVIKGLRTKVSIPELRKAKYDIKVVPISIYTCT